MELPFAESWKIKMVEPIRKSTREERERWLKEADYNVFMLRADQVYIDCLTDSGTGAMSDRQWAAMMTGDESYAGARSFYELKDTITRITGFEYVIPTHQGRAAENVLFSHLVKNGDIVPGNSHFDTTKGHIESRKAFAVDCTVDEAKNTQLEIPFKGKRLAPSYISSQRVAINPPMFTSPSFFDDIVMISARLNISLHISFIVASLNSGSRVLIK